MTGNSDLDNKQAVESQPEVALREQIERRAYRIWLAGGGRHGEDLRHWLQAESEVLKALSQEQAERSSTRKTSGTPKLRSSPVPNETIPKE